MSLIAAAAGGNLVISRGQRSTVVECWGGGSGGSVISADVNTIYSTKAGLMLAHRLRRWPSINPTLSRRALFADTPSAWIRW